MNKSGETMSGQIPLGLIAFAKFQPTYGPKLCHRPGWSCAHVLERPIPLMAQRMQAKKVPFSFWRSCYERQSLGKPFNRYFYVYPIE